MELEIRNNLRLVPGRVGPCGGGAPAGRTAEGVRRTLDGEEDGVD